MKTKLPHFVPSAYLQYWDIGGNKRGRDSELWVTDADKKEIRAARYLARWGNFYSKTNPDEAETYFQEYEGDWPKIINRVLRTDDRRPDLSAVLILVNSSILFLRNPSFEDQAHKERIDTIKLASDTFLHKILLDGEELIDDKEKILEQLLQRWHCHLLPAKGDLFITSDNPCIALSIQDNVPGMFLLPLTPQWLFFAHNGSITLTSSELNERDTEFINSYSVLNCLREIYSSKELNDDEHSSFIKWMARKPDLCNMFNEDFFHMELFKYPTHNLELSFLSYATDA